MRKYLILIYITFSVMSYAQFTDNVFDQNQSTTDQQQHTPNPAPSQSEAAQTEASPSMYAAPAEENQSSIVGNGPGEHEEGPGNPGEPVPINGYLPLLLLGGLALMLYYHRKSTKINI